jgi:3-oxoacyl-[acyl-carrier protein] reductase
MRDGGRNEQTGDEPEPSAAIVVVSSVQGIVGSPHLVAYGAAKAGLIHLVRTLALELAPDRIRVNAIAPSIIETPSVAALVDPERRRASEASIPLGRIGRVEDVAGLAVTLASPLGAYVTGQTLVVDGGLSLTTARPTRAEADAQDARRGAIDAQGERHTA